MGSRPGKVHGVDTFVWFEFARICGNGQGQVGVSDVFVDGLTNNKIGLSIDHMLQIDLPWISLLNPSIFGLDRSMFHV